MLAGRPEEAMAAWAHISLRDAMLCKWECEVEALSEVKETSFPRRVYSELDRNVRTLSYVTNYIFILISVMLGWALIRGNSNQCHAHC